MISQFRLFVGAAIVGFIALILLVNGELDSPTKKATFIVPERAPLILEEHEGAASQKTFHQTVIPRSAS